VAIRGGRLSSSKRSILIIEDDSRISRLTRDYLHECFPGMRVEIAGSAAKAKAICQQFPPALIIWDGVPNERGTREEYASCIPEVLWRKVIPISVDETILEFAKQRGALEPVPKKVDMAHAWVKELAERVRVALSSKKKK